MCMEKQELFSIGDVAKLFHISVSSLRHYEKSGLWNPNILILRRNRKDKVYALFYILYFGLSVAVKQRLVGFQIEIKPPIACLCTNYHDFIQI